MKTPTRNIFQDGYDKSLHTLETRSEFATDVSLHTLDNIYTTCRSSPSYVGYLHTCIYLSLHVSAFF